ncbi:MULTISPECIES: YrrS family protein [Bacillaceae]|uniref:DUF1510 family protein n=1 Tax=Evansella alkalicola TaxID=745819 RepID=A0ABS6JQ11_9BACI|nr:MULTISPECIES: YrrS family protein [Bacillaceae]MBU9720654.1 DUF1510 family protein [Bacillus alkalicola]
MSYGSYGPRRTEIRKEKRKNIWLNGAIAVTIIGIVFVASMLIFSGGDSEPAAVEDVDPDDQNQAEMAENEDDNALDENEGDSTPSDDVDTNDSFEEEAEPADDSLSEVNEGENDSENGEELVFDGEWRPIGTEQEEPFELNSENLSRDHVNWQEMTLASMYATGISEDDITVWRFGNGGDMKSVEAWVSDYENRDTPYKVRLEWVTNEGWVPVSVEKQEENPFR